VEGGAQLWRARSGLERLRHPFLRCFFFFKRCCASFSLVFLFATFVLFLFQPWAPSACSIPFTADNEGKPGKGDSKRRVDDFIGFFTGFTDYFLVLVGV
jgi:hypothetical protein